MAFNSEYPLCKEVSPDKFSRPKRIRKKLDHLIWLGDIWHKKESYTHGYSIEIKIRLLNMPETFISWSA